MSWYNPSTWLAAPKLVDNVFDKDNGLLTQVGTFIGNQSYSEQEKAIDQKALATAVQTFAVATMGENTDRSKTRRKLAVKWFDMHIWLIKLWVLFFALDKAMAGFKQPPLNLSGDFSQITFSGSIWAVTSGIGIFFWGSHALRSSKLSK